MSDHLAHSKLTWMFNSDNSDNSLIVMHVGQKQGLRRNCLNRQPPSPRAATSPCLIINGSEGDGVCAMPEGNSEFRVQDYQISNIQIHMS